MITCVFNRTLMECWVVDDHDIPNLEEHIRTLQEKYGTDNIWKEYILRDELTFEKILSKGEDFKRTHRVNW